MNRIALHGLPRTGTSWVGEVFNSCPHLAYRYQPLFSYAFKSYLGPDSTKKKIWRFYDEILNTNDDFVLRKGQRDCGLFPKFEKSELRHVLYKEVRYHHIVPNLLREDPELKIIFILRNPFSTVNSWLNAPQEFRADLGWSRLEEWRYAPKKNMNLSEEFNGYERWKEVSKMFISLEKIYPERIWLLNYADLIKSPLLKFRHIFEQLDLEFSPQTIQFLSSSSSQDKLDPYSVYRKNQSDSKWIGQLEPEIVEEITKDLESTELDFLLPISL